MLSEDEILTMSGATVEAYQATGSKLYAVKYVEPGSCIFASILSNALSEYWFNTLFIFSCLVFFTASVYLFLNLSRREWIL